MKTCLALSALLLALYIGSSGAEYTKWNALRTKWNVYNDQPTTKADAIARGYESLGNGVCGSPNKFNGYAYAPAGDTSVVILYDASGYIAGMQIRFSADDTDPYPSDEIVDKFIRVGDEYYLTAYFTDDASSICTEGRSAEEYERDGVGSGLWLQVGQSPDLVQEIPRNESDVTDQWVKGQCFPTMGMHYWYKNRVDTSCGDIQPIFGLYNGGELTAFGWAVRHNMTSSNFERPPSKVVGMFMKEVPTCLVGNPNGYLSTMHTFLTSDSQTANRC